MKMYIKGNDILEFKRFGTVWSYLWDTFEGLEEWFNKNLQYILIDDLFPFDIEDNTGEEITYNFLNSNKYLKENIKNDFELEKQYKILGIYQNWLFKHYWLINRKDSLLANVIFRKVNNKIEISWNNYNLYERENIKFLYKRGFYFVEIENFNFVIAQFLKYCNDLKR